MSFTSQNPDRVRFDKATIAHRKAMEIADEYLMRRPQPAAEVIQSLAREALAFEVEALGLIHPQEQPSHGVLSRSAATLALDAGDHDQVRSLVERGLASQNLDPEIRAQLFEVLEKIGK